MKNKLFWPIIIVSVVVLIESLLLISDKKTVVNVEKEVNQEEITLTEAVVQKAVSFYWTDEEKPTLMMRAEKEVAVDAIDLYVAYKGGSIVSINNLGDLPKPSFQKDSKEKSLVVLNYLISESEGLKLIPGQEIRVIQLGVKAGDGFQLSIDPKTQVVENGTAKVLPFNSQNLIINSAL